MPFQSLAKFLIFGGFALIIAGLMFFVFARFFPTGVPGDIAYKRGNTAIYFPIVSSIILSIVATIVLNIVMRFFR
ncbi:MAG TPA: DUF2905 domain-containing protein [Abditibacterium sp.]|jgi:uncharacterized membrane protein YvlD (DUF360 family)